MAVLSQVSDEGDKRISVTCRMNCLQDLFIEAYGPIFVTINPYVHRWRNKVVRCLRTRFTQWNALKAKEIYATFRMRDLSYYVVAWTKLSFQEDRFSSGLRVAKAREPSLPIESLIQPFQGVDNPQPATGIVGYG
jgi:predicted NAD/FAD-binding protein